MAGGPIRSKQAFVMEGKQHKYLKKIIQLNLARKSYIVYPEVYANYINGTLDVVGAQLNFEKVQTIGIEVKTSRNDFFSSKQKYNAAKEDQFDEKELGTNFKYFFTPAGLVKKSEVYKGWGLFEFKKGRVIKLVEAPRREVDNNVVMYYMARVAYNLYHKKKTKLMLDDFSWLNYSNL